MRNRRTLAEVEKLKRSTLDPDAIGRMIAVIEQERGYRLYDAVGQVKRAWSETERAHFHIAGADRAIEADVARDEFEGWIAPEIARIKATVDSAVIGAGVAADAVDRVFLIGSTSLMPRQRRLFFERLGGVRIASGNKLTSIAHELALIEQEQDMAG